MDDVHALLLGNQCKCFGFLGLRLHALHLSYDEGESIVLRLLFRLVEDCRFVVSARIACWTSASAAGKADVVAPNPSVLGLGCLNCPVGTSVCLALHDVWVDAYIVDVVLESVMPCNRIAAVALVLLQPVRPVANGLEDKTCGSAFVEK